MNAEPLGGSEDRRSPFRRATELVSQAAGVSRSIAYPELRNRGSAAPAPHRQKHASFQRFRDSHRPTRSLSVADVEFVGNCSVFHDLLTVRNELRIFTLRRSSWRGAESRILKLTPDSHQRLCRARPERLPRLDPQRESLQKDLRCLPEFATLAALGHQPLTRHIRPWSISQELRSARESSAHLAHPSAQDGVAARLPLPGCYQTVVASD